VVNKKSNVSTFRYYIDIDISIIMWSVVIQHDGLMLFTRHIVLVYIFNKQRDFNKVQTKRSYLRKK